MIASAAWETVINNGWAPEFAAASVVSCLRDFVVPNYKDAKEYFRRLHDLAYPETMTHYTIRSVVVLAKLQAVLTGDEKDHLLG